MIVSNVNVAGIVDLDHSVVSLRLDTNEYVAHDVCIKQCEVTISIVPSMNGNVTVMNKMVNHHVVVLVRGRCCQRSYRPKGCTEPHSR
jgi:hypothetical protein